MLITCIECGLQVSDKAMSCPHCGYPMKGESKYPQNPKKSHKRLPNGFGQISLITSKPLRKPYRAMITVGRDKSGKPRCKLLKPESYFATYNEAYAALMEYNKNPYDLDTSITIGELYEKWTEEYFAKLKSKSSERTITAAWAYCNSIKNMRVKDVRSRHIKALMDQPEVSINTKNRMKSMFNLMLDYAVEYEICDKNYARDFKITEKAESKNHIAYTKEEMDILWNSQSDIANIILIQCYSGWRPNELLNLEFDWDKNIMKGGSKTKAGINRVVPIHPKIIDIAKKEEELLKSLTYDAYFKKYKNFIKQIDLNPEHKPHDGRKTFITMAKTYNVDEYAIKRLVGHAIPDITENIYTERDFKWLKKEISRIK